MVCVSKAFGPPFGCGCGGAQSRGEAGVLRKDSEAIREKVAFKLKQKNLQGRIEISCAANEEEEVWDLQALWYNVSGSGRDEGQLRMVGQNWTCRISGCAL